MKKIFTLAVAAVLAMAMAVVGFAASYNLNGGGASYGALYHYDDGTLIHYDGGKTLTPGKTYYVYLGDAKPSSSKAKLSYKCVGIADDKSIKPLSTSLSISRKKTNNEFTSGSAGYYGYFAELSVKEISASSYSSDGYEFQEFLITYKDNSKNDIEIDGAGADLEYADGDTTVTDVPQFFTFEDEEDIDIDIEGTDIKLELNAKGTKIKTLLAMDTDYNQTISNKYPDAYLEFYNGNGGSLGKRSATVIIPKGDYKYLYSYSGSTLKQITSKNSDGDFEFKSTTLGKYILSDTKLSGVAEVTPSPTPTPGVTPTPSLQPPYGGGTLPSGGGSNPHFNPGTGASV